MDGCRKNLIDFRCYSNGNSEKTDGLQQKNTLRETYKLIYIYAGAFRIEIDGIIHKAEKGDSVLVFPNCSFEIHDKDGSKYVWLEFSGFESTAILCLTAFTMNTPVLGKIRNKNFEKNFILPADPANTGNAYELYRIGASIMMLLSYYLEYFPGKPVKPEGYVFCACRIIDNRFSEHGFCVKDVAEALKIDRSHLYRMFKDEMGISVIDYITVCRISKAEIMLTNINLSVKDVAYSVGFSDQMYFSRVFKRLNGKTPTQFREMIINGNGTQTKP